MRQGRASNTGSDNRHAVWRRHLRFRLPREDRLQAFPLAAETGLFGDLEAGLGKAAPDKAGNRESADPGARCRQAANRIQNRLGPHGRIAGGRKSVEEPGIHTGLDLTQGRLDLVMKEGDGKTVFREDEPVRPLEARWPLRQQALGQMGQGWPLGEGASDLLPGQGVFFDRDEVQPGA